MVSRFQSDLEACLAVLEKGGLILYPTDTIWGIGCDATNAAAVEKIFKLKKRPDEKTMIVLLAEEEDIIKYISKPDPRIADYLKALVKPTTVIYDGAVGFAENLVSPDQTIAIRIVKDLFCKHLIKRLHKPLVSTSANITGFAAPQTFAEIDDVIKNGVDYIVQHRQEEKEPAQPSTIIKWNADGAVTVIRS